VFVCLNLNSKHPAPTDNTLTSQQPSLSAASPVNSDDDKVNVFAIVNGVLAKLLNRHGRILQCSQFYSAFTVLQCFYTVLQCFYSALLNRHGRIDTGACLLTA